jgi:hypothetical protein
VLRKYAEYHNFNDKNNLEHEKTLLQEKAKGDSNQ